MVWFFRLIICPSWKQTNKQKVPMYYSQNLAACHFYKKNTWCVHQIAIVFQKYYFCFAKQKLSYFPTYLSEQRGMQQQQFSRNGGVRHEVNDAALQTCLASHDFNVHAETRRKLPTLTASACVLRSISMKAEARRNPGCSALLPTVTHQPGEQPNHQSEVKFKSYSRCHAEVKQHKAGGLKRQEYISFPFTLFIMPNAEREKQKRIKTHQVLSLISALNVGSCMKE